MLLHRLLISLVLMLVLSVSASAEIKEHWYGAYLNTQKIGYMCYKIEDIEIDGAKCYRFSSILNNQLKILGADLSQLVTTVVTADKDMKPMNQDFSMSSGGRTTAVRARFYPDRIECVVSAGTGSSTKIVPVNANEKLVVDNLLSVGGSSPKVGDDITSYYFNPLTLSVDVLKTKVDRKEKITISGHEYDALVLKNRTGLGDMTIWQTDQGELLQVEAIMGIHMVQEPMEQAMSGAGGASQKDLAVLTSIKPDKAIKNPRKVTKIDLVLSGMEDKEFAISDYRQKAVLDAEKKAARIRITASKTPVNSIEFPIADPELQKFVISTPYIDCDRPDVKKQAKEIAGDEKNILIVCKKMTKWIHSNMSYRADIGIARSASDVLGNRSGVCRDYAILMAGMARSIGIPAKVVSGIVYANGAFYYHAWVECYAGKWIPFDPTLSTEFVDATHIKLAEGDATSMFTLSKVIGGLKARVVSYK